MKSKVYVRDYENMNDLKASIVATFQELTTEMVSSTLKNIEKRLKLINYSAPRWTLGKLINAGVKSRFNIKW